MALDVIRNVLGQVAMRGLQERSATGRAALIGQQLQNALAQRQLDELFPLQVQQLQKTIANILDPQQAITNAVSEFTQKEQLRQSTEEAIIKAREAMEKGVLQKRYELENAPMSKERYGQEIALRKASLYDQPRNTQTVTLMQGPDGQPSQTPHIWTLNPGGTLGTYIGPTTQRQGAAATTSPTLLKEMRQSQTGRLNAKGEVVEEASEELNQLRVAMGKVKPPKFLGLGGGDPSVESDEFFDQLVAMGWPKTQQDAIKYPSLAQAVSEWRNALATSGPSEMSMQMSAPEELVETNGMTFRKNPDGSYTRVK